jgi:uncharacterized paraquat-inducible protein A
MRLFKRNKDEELSSCPRCSQLISDDHAVVCPMCGWDLADAYQGPLRGAAAQRREAGEGPAADLHVA